MVNPTETMSGALRIKIIRGTNLVVRDLNNSSDPFVMVTLANQKVMTNAIPRTLNPEWNDSLTLKAPDGDEPLIFNVYDSDMFFDDKMGDAEVDMKPFMDCVRMKLEGLEEGTIICKMKPGRDNCLVEKSNIIWMDGTVSQNMFLRLRNVESGMIEIQLQWIDIASLRGSTFGM